MAWMNNYLNEYRCNLGLCWLVCLGGLACNAQTDASQQLLLDWQKLGQMRMLVANMKNGYESLNQGYQSIAQAASAMYHLHEAWADSMLVVSSGVKQDPGIPGMLQTGQEILKGYAAFLGRMEASGELQPNEIMGMYQAYGVILSASRTCMDELERVLSDSMLRMNDGERLTAIDRLSLEMSSLGQSWNALQETVLHLIQQRELRRSNMESVKNLYGQ
jgi:hypothetical protein